MPAASKAATVVTEELPWCGSCNPRTRLRQDLISLPDGDFAEGPVRRCECHPPPKPSTGPTVPSCGKHSVPPGTSCALCEHGIGTVSHDTCSPESSCYVGKVSLPMPYDPMNLQKASIRQIARELTELREPGWYQTRTEDLAKVRNDPRYQAALRDLALHQISVSRV